MTGKKKTNYRKAPCLGWEMNYRICKCLIKIRHLSVLGLSEFAVRQAITAIVIPCAQCLTHPVPLTLPGLGAIITLLGKEPAEDMQISRASSGTRTQTSVTLCHHNQQLYRVSAGHEALCSFKNHIFPYRKWEPICTCKENPRKLNSESLKIPIFH